MKTNLEKKIVLITGSSSGIGFGLAKKFLEDGNNVIICSKNKTRLKNASKKLNNCFFLRADLTKLSEINSAIKKLKKKYKKIDLLVCNYGNSNFEKNNFDIKNAFENNFFSTVNTINETLPIIKQKTGKIICISSICGIEKIQNAPIGYSLAKSALNNYVKMISNLLAKDNILINSIALGNIFFKGSTWDKKIKKNRNKILSYLKYNVPLNKFGTIDEIYNLCNYLSSNQNFSTGATYILDGGQTRTFF